MTTPTNVNPEATQVQLTGSNTGNEYLIDPDTGQPYDASHPLPVSASVTPPSAVVSTVNSSTTPLGSNGVFTGTSESSLNYGSISVEVFADQASASNGLSVQQSPDGTNWDTKNQYTISASTAFQQSINLVGQFFRIVYTNGAVAQGTFRLQVVKEVNTSGGASNQRVNAQSGDFVDGANATLGAKSDAAVTDSTTSNTQMSFTKGLVKILADMWDSTNHWLQVKVMNGNNNGQATMINSAPVVIASNQSTLPTLDTNSAGIKSDLDTLVTQTATPNVSDRWARQVGQVDLARVLGAALAIGNPNITESNIQNAIRAGQAYEATTGNVVTATNANLAVCAMSIFNPSNSGKTILIYDIQVGATSTSGFGGSNRLVLTTTDPSGTTGYTGTPTVVNLKAGGAAQAASVSSSPTGITAAPAVSGTSFHYYAFTGSALLQLLQNGECIVLPNGSANGLSVMIFVSVAGNNFLANVKWIEF